MQETLAQGLSTKVFIISNLLLDIAMKTLCEDVIMIQDQMKE